MDGREELERAYACDSAGREDEAVVHYRRAFELGVPDEELASASLGFGSTLRNVGEHEEAVRVLADACERFPVDAALKVFRGYALWSAGRPGDAMRSLVDALYAGEPRPELRRYERSIRGYAGDL